MKNPEHLQISSDSADSFCATFGLRCAVGLTMSKISSVVYPEKR